MDLSFLPNIFAILVLVAAFRPFVGRIGAHVNLWFLGWTFLLIRLVALSFSAPGGLRHTVTALIAIWALQLCALAFVLAVSNAPDHPVSSLFVLEITLPVLLQSALSLGVVQHPNLQRFACLLFLAPAIHILLSSRKAHEQRFGRQREWGEPSRPLVVSIAFATFAFCAVPFAARYPALITQGVLSLLFLLAAYLHLLSTRSRSSGVIAALAGLTAWGLSFPAVLALAHFFPTIHINQALLDLPQYVVISGIIVTLLEAYVGRTERMAMHDPLTDLPNLRLFEERLIATMTEARLHGTTVACLVIDVDNFKAVNDTLGHAAGDQLLRALSVRLSWHISPRDMLARTGGDEFMALLAGVNDENHLRFIAGAMMSAASVPIMIDGKAVDLGISIGMALSPDHADDIDTLRRAADRAMYSAKRRGGSMLAFADEEQEVLSEN